LNNPSGIARNPSTGDIYVADTGNNRILKYSPGSTVPTVVAGGNGQGTGTNQLFTPRAVYYDAATSSLVITNSGANNIVRWPLGSSNWTLLAGSSSGVAGSSTTTLNRPSGVTFDPSGNMYVADTNNHRIQYFPVGQTTGTTVAGTSGISGSGANSLNRPAAVVLDSQLNIYVADQGNNRIQRFPRI
jgi:DNA-binding beta-propeller fold protein YncE